MGNCVMLIAFSTNFVGVFALLPDLHNSFSQSGAKTTYTACANKQHYFLPEPMNLNKGEFLSNDSLKISQNKHKAAFTTQLNVSVILYLFF